VQPAYYRDDLALVHHLGFGTHADACAPGILALLEPVRERRGLVLELGCGSGRLTRHLIDAGHRVVATDASLSMLALARDHTRGAEDIRQLTLPEDPLPEVDAIVSVGHALSYLPNEAALEKAMTAIGMALRVGGVLALDLCDVAWGQVRRDTPMAAWVQDDWALVTRFSITEANRFVREMTTFVRNHDGCWRRDDERHENILIDTAKMPAVLARHGIAAKVAPSFGSEKLPEWLVAIVGMKSPA